MKKINQSLLLLFIIILFGVSCNNIDSIETNLSKSDAADKLFLTEDQVTLLNGEFSFLNYKQNVDVRNNINFINNMKKDLLESNYSKLISDFNLSKVTVIEWDDYFSYTLASETVEGEYYTIILSKDVNDVNNNLNIKRFSGESFLLNIDATQDGTGTLKETSKYGINTAVFDKGKLCTVSFQEYTNSFTLRSGSVTFEVSDVEDLGDPLKGKLFRECFDKAYDTICDGFIGCLAWYTNPTVPITAAVWCTLK